MSFDSLSKVLYTLRISTLYLLTSSRKLTKTENVDILKTCRDYKVLSYKYK